MAHLWATTLPTPPAPMIRTLFMIRKRGTRLGRIPPRWQEILGGFALYDANFSVFCAFWRLNRFTRLARSFRLIPNLDKITALAIGS
jgi:hypothetical protein